MQKKFYNLKFIPALAHFFFLCVLIATGQAGEPPVFARGARLRDSQGEIQPSFNYSVPCVTDWNQDGKKDLLVGVFLEGNIFYYLNSGTNRNPVFTKASKLLADGKELTVAYT